MKILVAVDGSPCSEAAVAEVARRPWPAGSEVRLILADPPTDRSFLRGVPSDVLNEFLQSQRAEARQRLDAAAALLTKSAPALPVVPLLKEGWPKDVILDEAERWGADLIVVGSHGYGTLKRLFLGSVSLAVATHAPCSVEIVRVKTECASSATE
ncbi:MAG: universal stress protein [Planctomycetaceae bacterium]|nr:universal stress protein [Planctomycetaceae bacterium]